MQSATQQPKKNFRQWYEETFKTSLPIYIPNEIKKHFVGRFEKETGISYRDQEHSYKKLAV